MRIRSFLLPGFLLLACSFSLSGQKRHTLDWKTGTSPNVFDQMDNKGNGPQQPSPAERAALRQQRAAMLADLNLELDAVIHTAADLQERLKTADPNNTVSVELRNQGKRLEESARKIHKQIGSL
jgi:S1-C subfamily serine protease